MTLPATWFPAAAAYPSGASASGGIAGRIVVLAGRFANDRGFLGIHALSEFSAGYHVATNNDGEVVRRFERGVANRRNVARVLMMAANLFDLSPRRPGYWDAMAKMTELAASVGLYVEPCLFADAQTVLPARADRQALVRDYAAFCRAHVNVIPQLSNEPEFNGFRGATDPELLDLAESFASVYGSRDFSIGDPKDFVESESGGEPLAGFLRKLATICNILQYHDDRGEDAGRFARWVDHLKGMDDQRGLVNSKTAAYWHDEPMGMAGVPDVPLGNGRSYHREARAEALVAACCVAAITQTGFTTHYISEQHDTVPGLEASAIAADIPQTPDWRFINAGIGGSPVVSFSGFEKVRPSTNGRDAWACAYGKQKGSLTWASGFQPERVFNGSNVEVWRASR